MKQTIQRTEANESTEFQDLTDRSFDYLLKLWPEDQLIVGDLLVHRPVTVYDSTQTDGFDVADENCKIVVLHFALEGVAGDLFSHPVDVLIEHGRRNTHDLLGFT